MSKIKQQRDILDYINAAVTLSTLQNERIKELLTDQLTQEVIDYRAWIRSRQITD